MENTEQLLQDLIQKIDRLEKETRSGFSGVNKRLDGIDHELKKLNTVTKYEEKWNNIPA